MVKLFGHYKQRRRSASMELSVNAIVILVMAMAVLGIGLGLIRGVLNSGKERLTSSLESMDLTEVATAEKQITNTNKIVLNRAKENIIMIGFYNVNTPCEEGFNLNLDCEEGLIEEQQSTDVKISEGSSGKLGAIVTPANSGTYMCTAQVFCGEAESSVVEETAFIEVKS